MMRGVYVGRLHSLRGETALLLDGTCNQTVKAQFDNFEATRAGIKLAYGWHLFNASEFDICDENNNENQGD